jgi:hypothetical protein
MERLPRTSGAKTTLLRVRRHCLVCEYEWELEERSDSLPIGVPCAECHAPTERFEILARHAVAVDRNPHAAALGRLGGLKGGRARAESLSESRRQEIARGAARARWARHRRGE